MPSVSFLQKPASGGIRGWRVFILINRHMGNALLSGCCAFGLEHVALSSQGDSATAVYAAVWSRGGVLT